MYKSSKEKNIFHYLTCWVTKILLLLNKRALKFCNLSTKFKLRSISDALLHCGGEINFFEQLHPSKKRNNLDIAGGHIKECSRTKSSSSSCYRVYRTVYSKMKGVVVVQKQAVVDKTGPFIRSNLVARGPLCQRCPGIGCSSPRATPRFIYIFGVENLSV